MDRRKRAAASGAACHARRHGSPGLGGVSIRGFGALSVVQAQAEVGRRVDGLGGRRGALLAAQVAAAAGAAVVVVLAAVATGTLPVLVTAAARLPLLLLLKLPVKRNNTTMKHLRSAVCSATHSKSPVTM